MSKIWRSLLLLAAFAGSGAIQQPRQEVNPPPTALQWHESRWQSLRFAHYRYTLEILCRCGFTRQPYTFEVRDGKLISAIDGAGDPISGVDINAPPHSVDWFYSLSTIDTLFQHIDQAWDSAANVDIRYEWFYAYPEFTLVDWTAGQLGDEVGLYITNFEILP